jgi:hypothetical protein
LEKRVGKLVIPNPCKNGSTCEAKGFFHRPEIRKHHDKPAETCERRLAFLASNNDAQLAKSMLYSEKRASTKISSSVGITLWRPRFGKDNVDESLIPNPYQNGWTRKAKAFFINRRFVTSLPKRAKIV